MAKKSAPPKSAAIPPEALNPSLKEPAREAPSARTAFVPPPGYEPSPPPASETPRLRSQMKSPIRRPAMSEPAAKVRETPATSWPFWTGVVLTLGWFGAVLGVTMAPTGTFLGQPLANVALGLSGAMAPPALVWMVIAYLQRATDIRTITEPLRRQLQMVLGTGAQAENRVRRFNDALERQLELLRQAGDGSYEVLQGAVQVLQEEEQAIHALTERSSKEVSRVAGIVRDNSAVLEDLLDGNRQRFDDLSGRIASHVATLDDRAQQAASTLGDMVSRMEGLISDFLDVSEKKLSSLGNVSSAISVQEKESIEATRRMAEMLASARSGAAELNQILVQNQHILETAGETLLARMKEANAEAKDYAEASHAKEQQLAEKSRNLSQTLAQEIAALDTLTGRLDAQIAAANEGLAARSVELEARHTALAQQASQLMQNLQGTVASMEQNATSAYEKFAATSEHVQAQTMRAAQQFQMSGERYESMADKLEAISQNVANRVAAIGDNLSGQTVTLAQNTEKATEAALIAQKGVNETLERLELMIARIFDAEGKARVASNDITTNYGEVLDGMRQKLEGFGAEAGRHMQALTQLQDEFDGAGTRLAQRARETEGTWQSLVDAASRQQEVLQQQLRQKMEEATALLNENAVAIEVARDGLYTHIEAAFARAEDIKEELKLMGVAAQAPFEEGVRRVQTAVTQGQGQIAQFMDSLRRNA
ncbi:MAG TPA: hypothetical protein VHB73_06865, partial [Alphaproteobacteria bacterium]|nr:hypothetical protein [Alphaproteobacteria bacterium]